MRSPIAREKLAPARRDEETAVPGLDAFRRDLAITLRSQAERRRQALGGTGSFADQLDAIRLLEDLADDAKNVKPHVFLIYRSLLANDRLRRLFEREKRGLFARVGVDRTPCDATDLIRWMLREVGDMAYHEGTWPDAGCLELYCEPARDRPREQDRASGPSATQTFVLELSAGFGIVTPMLAIWEARQGFWQWRDQAFVAAHQKLPAMIVSLDQVDDGRSSQFLAASLAFTPPGQAECRVTLKRHSGTSFPKVGGTMDVVPRAPGCAEPLVPSQIGDPLATLTLSAALLVGGLSSLKLWAALRRRPGWLVEPPVSSRLRRSAYPARHPRPAL